MFRASAPFSASSTQLPSRLNQSAMIERQSGSSSTTNIVASFRCIFRLLNQRKKKGKASVVFNFGHLEFSSVFHDNRFRQAQSQASAFAHRLGRKKWLHDSRFELGRYAVPAINHCENNRLLKVRHLKPDPFFSLTIDNSVKCILAQALHNLADAIGCPLYANGGALQCC